MTEIDRRNDFIEHGYTIARGFFSASEMEALLSDLRRARPRKGRASRLDKDGMVFASNLFFESPRLQAFISQPRLVELVRQVLGPDFWVRWDQAVSKRPGAGEFPWHQDNAYNDLVDEHFQLWVAATPMTAENGRLAVIPGSHRAGRLPHRMIGSHAVYQGPLPDPVTIDAAAGDVVLFSSFLLHYTAPNVSQSDRWAYVIEYVSLDHFDPFIAPPYFVVAEDGRSAPRFVRLFRGRLRPANHLKYLLPLLRRLTRGAGVRLQRLRQATRFRQP